VARAILPAKLFALVSVVLVAYSLQAQTSSKSSQSFVYPAIKSIRMIQAKDGPAVEILTTKPVIPAVQTIENPWRLVIDVPNARLDIHKTRIAVQGNIISSLRANQFQENPPVARIVLDLKAPLTSTWKSAGNRLIVHLGQNPSAEEKNPAPQQATEVSLTTAPPPVIAASLRPGALVTLAGEGVVSGSSFTAGEDRAVLNLARGGQVDVCPGTTLSVTPSQNRHNVMLAMNTGAMEAHYYLDASSDSVVTPDFRILLTGPGEFHYAISADTRGNTCVRALPGNTSAAIVSELMGDRTYQVRATDQLLFHSGRLDQVDSAVPLECGCPPRQPVLRAENIPPKIVQAPPSNPQRLGEKSSASTLDDRAETTEATITPLGSASGPKEIHMRVEAPLVFRAADLPPAPVGETRALPPDSRQLTAVATADPLPPAPPEMANAADPPAQGKPASHRGFFGKLRGVFSAMFR
jgi:AMIN domain-containing protein